MNKYRNIKYRGFDSKREAKRYDELKLMERAGLIKNLRTQVKYELIPSQRDKDGKVIERACTYIADFVYLDANTFMLVVEDTKGFRTPEYVIKRKLMLQKYGIRIKEV